MARTYKRRELVDASYGQHLALSVAAHLTRTQLVPDPLNSYDAQHLLESVEAVASALVGSAPLYAKGAADGQLRLLEETEVQGARVENGGKTLLLKDGRALSAVCIKRADLREAIAILKAVGIPGLTRPLEPKTNDRVSNGQTSNQMAQLRQRLNEVGDLLRLPFTPAQVNRANKLIIEIARAAPRGQISNLAMRLMSAVHDACSGGDDEAVRLMLARLRSAVEVNA
jgi:hypothetical protein